MCPVGKKAEQKCFYGSLKAAFWCKGAFRFYKLDWLSLVLITNKLSTNKKQASFNNFIDFQRIPPALNVMVPKEQTSF